MHAFTPDPPKLQLAQVVVVDVLEEFGKIKEFRRQLFDVVRRLVERVPRGRDRVELAVGHVESKFRRINQIELIKSKISQTSTPR